MNSLTLILILAFYLYWAVLTALICKRRLEVRRLNRLQIGAILFVHSLVVLAVSIIVLGGYL